MLISGRIKLMRYFYFLIGLLLVSFLTEWGMTHLLAFRRRKWYWAAVAIIVFYLLVVLLALIVTAILPASPAWISQVAGAILTIGLFVFLIWFFYREKWQKILLITLIFFAVLLLFDFIWMTVVAF